MKHIVAYRTKDITLIEGVFKHEDRGGNGYRFIAYQDPLLFRIIFFVPVEEEGLEDEYDTLVFEQPLQVRLQLDHPNELLDLVEFYGETFL